MLLHLEADCSLLVLYNILLHGHITNYLSILLLINIQVVSSLGLL